MKFSYNDHSRKSVKLMLCFVFMLLSCNAATLKVLVPTETAIGFPHFGNVTLDQFDEIITAPLSASDAVSGADAYWVILIAGGGATAPFYTNDELNSLSSILSSSAPAVIFFEWLAWRNSSQQLAGLLGSTYLESGLPAEAAPQGDSLLVRDISAPLLFSTPGGLSGAVTPVFGDVVTLAGPNQNVALIGDTTTFTSFNPSNRQFAENLGEFLAIPETTTISLFLVALSCLSLSRQRSGLSGTPKIGPVAKL
jgi:hypothetical protein